MWDRPTHLTRYSKAPDVFALKRAPKITSTCRSWSGIWSTTPLLTPPPPSPRPLDASTIPSTFATAPPARKMLLCLLCISPRSTVARRCGCACEADGTCGRSAPGYPGGGMVGIPEAFAPRATGAGALNPTFFV